MAKSVINCSRTQLTPSSNASSSMPSTSNGLKTHSSESGNNVSTLQAGEDDRLSGSSYQDRPIVKQPKFEAYMMTGELMLNLSPMERSELQYMHHPHHHHHAPRHRPFYHRYNSTPASPVDTRQVTSGSDDGPVQRYNSSPAETGLSNNSDSSSNEVSDPKMFNSTPASPAGEGVGTGHGGNRLPPPCVRTSRSEDHLQKESSLSTVAVDIDEDITSSLNTLLDTRPDSRSGSSQSQQNGADRIVWTYNAPVSSASERTMPQCNGSSGTSNSTSMSDGMSQSCSCYRSMSPVSPTSVSSSVMSSTPPAPVKTLHHPHGPVNGDLSLSEAVSNISSPDFQDLDDTFEAGRDCPRMELSDPSDSDSTILVSEPCQKRAKCTAANMMHSNGHKSDSNLTNGDHQKDYRIVIQVKGPDKQLAESPMHKSGSTKGSMSNSENSPGRSTPEALGYQELHSEDAAGNCETGSDDGSDVDSLHSFHYSPKAVDIPSAVRLAKRLYHLDGFKKSDVSRHLSKNNEFSKAVAEEYVKHFDFASDSLDAALRRFLARFALGGETQERERVLVHFSRRYLECNPGTFNSQDAVHTLTCAIMLLNTDLHGAGAGFRRMTCAEFVDNLAELNDGQDFPREVLKLLYQAIRVQPLEWALDSEAADHGEAEGDAAQKTGNCVPTKIQSNTFLDIPDQSRAKEFKKGYVMRKSCYEANAKKTPFGKRSWKMFYCTLRDLVLYLHKDERGFRRDQMSDNFHNTIRIHHALATKATDYTKKQHVFRLQTADQAEYLFQTSDSKELQSWIETINFVCAAFSAQPLASAVGSQKKFQRPLLPCSHSKFSLGEQLAEHESRCAALESELKLLKQGSGGPHSQDEENYLQFELKRYRTYVQVLTWKSICSGGEELKLTPPPLPERPPPRHDAAPDADVP